MSFQIGERVVYPNQGVGTIENISSRMFGPKTERFYLLRLASSSLTIMVPFSHVSDVGLRKVTRTTDIQRMLDFLSFGKCSRCADWKNRFKENSEKMRVGFILEVAEVFKCLLLQQKDKPLSFREKKMLDRAKYLLVTELATARNTSAELVENMLVKSLAKAHLRMPAASELAKLGE
jgi:CarD family transcriptional regulator